MLFKKKEYLKNPFNCIVFGFFFNIIGFAFISNTHNQFLMVAFNCIGWYYIIKGYVRIAKHGVHFPFRGGYKFLFIFYLIICSILIIRGYTIDYNYQWISVQGCINFHLFSPYYILPYLMPLIVFIPYKYINLNLFIKLATILAIIGTVTSLIFYQDIVASSLKQAKGTGGTYGFGTSYADIYVPMAFAVLCKKYISNKIWLINSIGLVFSLLIFLISARRGAAVVLLVLFLFNIYIYVKSLNLTQRFFAIFLSTILIFCAVAYYKSSNTFTFLKERGMEDTRSGVDKALLQQMSDIELIFGKGLNGRYYYPLSNDDYLGGWRYASETGFYTLILKGGYIMAALHILLLIYPALLGLFYSNNILSKAFGLYIILSIFELYPFGWLTFNMKFLIIWIGVSLCYNKKFRSINDKSIHTYLF